jgi:KipI family sensor histidine kinase inhibitor
MDASISTVRLESPRSSVPAGSIGIAGNQTGIYPKSSPGGWNIIGQTPLSIFNAENPVESSVKMGDKVRFRPINESEFNILAINQ